MHIAHVHVHVKPGMEDEFVDACVANAASSVLEPDNLRFDVLRSGAFYHLTPTRTGPHTTASAS
jgi:quinol monooxygenase YgiN